MTFIDISQGKPSPSLITGYAILCIVSLLCAYWAVNIGLSRQHYQSFFSVRVLFPIALLILALENAALAASGVIYDTLEESGEENYDSLIFFKAVFVLQTFEVPILLIVIFEITYLVHKRRSVNFCGMYFDEGARVDSTAYTGCVLRNSIRTLSTILALMGLVVNFNLIQTQTEVDRLAGRAGWWALSREDLESHQRFFLLLSLIPPAILILVAFYLSIMLWRYGTESSVVLHSSICNPWFYSFFGTLAMAIGQLFAAGLYTFMSNLGVLIFIITILLLMAEVDKDMVATNRVACFLSAVAQKGDELRIIDTVPPLSKYPQQHDHPSYEEEKRPEDEESGVAVLTNNRENAVTLLDQNNKKNISRAEKYQIAHDDKVSGPAEFINQDEENSPESKENTNDIPFPEVGLELACTMGDDGNEENSFTSEDAYNEFLCVLKVVVSGPAEFINQDEESRPESKENTNDIPFPEVGLELTCTTGDDGNEENSFTSEDAYNEFLCVLESKPKPISSNDA